MLAPPVLVVGPNPATDIILEVPELSIGQVTRSVRSLHLAGGKPMNVARTLRRLRCPAQLVAPVGPGSPIPEACDDLGVDLRAAPIAQVNRTCVIVVANGLATVVNEPGPEFVVGESSAYEELIRHCVVPEALVVASGSVPPGLPREIYARLARTVEAVGARLIVDTSGDALALAIEAAPWAVKVNQEELAAVTGTHDCRQGTAHLLAIGIQHVVVTLGPDGCRYFSRGRSLSVSAAAVPTVNPVGCGDAFLAGLAAGLRQGGDWEEALRQASAVAGLVARSFGPDIGRQDPGELLSRVTVTEP